MSFTFSRLSLNSSLWRYSGSSKSVPLYLSEFSSKNLTKTSDIKEMYLSSSVSPSTSNSVSPFSKIKFITSSNVIPKKSLGFLDCLSANFSLAISVNIGSTILAKTVSPSLSGSPKRNTIPSTSLSRLSLRAVFSRSGLRVEITNLTKDCVLNFSTNSLNGVFKKSKRSDFWSSSRIPWNTIGGLSTPSISAQLSSLDLSWIVLSILPSSPILWT